MDTNILIYAYSEDEPKKQSVALQLLDSFENNVIISKQVINELSNILLKKFKLDSDQVENVLLEIDNVLPIVDFDLTTQIKALKLKDRYQFQYYDALIVATALENNCTVVYSEDMQHEMLIDGSLNIINPFN
ncbi:MAG: PIN domain-containing protein [Sulfuricurvum sp.]|uniref:PIN domain-containing protein n=1 Tax=Sulfuricurvum sp. TaxID=2025608 RepID=UPI0025D28EED|nr:PIN domain-containing protein [Sulfuricurvum sp.]MCI4406824.1 PIN domain-containing protein [Sulfuricurvum sp.]